MTTDLVDIINELDDIIDRLKVISKMPWYKIMWRRWEIARLDARHQELRHIVERETSGT